MLRIANGRVYDPANGVDGEIRDVCIADGRIVGDVPPEAQRIDARGLWSCRAESTSTATSPARR